MAFTGLSFRKEKSPFIGFSVCLIYDFLRDIWSHGPGCKTLTIVFTRVLEAVLSVLGVAASTASSVVAAGVSSASSTVPASSVSAWTGASDSSGVASEVPKQNSH